MLNQCSFIGNLGRDPETRTFSNGNKVCNLRVACTEKWKDSNGERKEHTEWVSVAIFNDGLVRICEQYLKKGSKVFIQGKMKTRKYQDQSGADKYSTEIVLQGFGGTLTMLDGPSGSTGEQSGGGNYDAPAGGGYDQGGGGNPNSGRDLNDTIPFAPVTLI